MKKQLLKFSNEHHFAHYHVIFDSAETYRDLFAKIKNELDLSSQEEFEMSFLGGDGENYTYELYKTEELNLEDDSVLGYKMVNSSRNG